MPKTVSFQGRTLPVKQKLPSSADVGSIHALKTKKGRVIIFKRTDNPRFKWKILANMPA